MSPRGKEKGGRKMDKKFLKIGAIVPALLLLIWGAILAANQGQADSAPPISVQPAPGGTPPPPGNPDELPAPPNYTDGKYVNPKFKEWAPDISEEEWKKIAKDRAALRSRDSNRSGDSNESAPPPLPNENFGTIIDVNTDYTVTYAGQEVRTEVNLPNGDYLYAPTLFADRSRLESTTFYHGTAAGTERFWCAWDHFEGNCIATKPFDANFFQKYVRAFSEGNLYFTQTWKRNGESRTYLYNFETSSWELPAAVIGTSAYADGWDIFEIHFYSNTCPSLPNIGSDYLQVYNGNSWAYATPSNSQCGLFDRLRCILYSKHDFAELPLES